MSADGDRTRVVVVAYDSSWPRVFAGVEAEIRARFGATARDVLHIGSTAVPGLAAKPIVDVALLVDDSAVEAPYLDALSALGYRLVVREPEWYEHRMFNRDDPAVNLHVFSVDCEEVDRVVCFRDWLRTHTDDRELYAATKRELAAQEWQHVQDYADAKGAVVEQILRRARAATA